MLLYHCTKNEAEFAEVVSILGNSRKFKIGHLRLDVKLGRTEGLTIEEMAKKKGWLLLCCCWRKFSKTRKKKKNSELAVQSRVVSSLHGDCVHSNWRCVFYRQAVRRNRSCQICGTVIYQKKKIFV